MIKFRNIIGKPKSGKESGKSEYLVGNELNDIAIGKYYSALSQIESMLKHLLTKMWFVTKVSQNIY